MLNVDEQKQEAIEQPTPLVPLQGGDKTGYVFGKENGFPYTPDFYSKNFKRACRKAGIDEAIHFHSTRHGCFTKMIMSGAKLPAVQLIAGHSQLRTLMGYTHPELSNLREAVEKL